MSLAQIFVTVAGFGLMAAVAWVFWGPRGEGTRAQVTRTGRQEVLVRVKGGYTPDVIRVQAGAPVRLNFRREESSSCTEMVVFPEFDRAAQLPEGQTVPVDLLPERPGEYHFSCQMGMVRGRLVAT